MGVHHTTVMTWVRQVGEQLPDAYAPETTPQMGELDELETFVGSKKTKSGCGQQLTPSNQESEAGYWETAVRKLLLHYGRSWLRGNVTSTSPMAGLFIQDLSQTETRLSVRLT